MKILFGNSFPLSLIRYPVRIRPRCIDEVVAVLQRKGWTSYWGHENTAAIASAILGQDIRPARLRPVLSLSQNQLPSLDGEIYREAWVLSPIYQSNFRPALGQEVSTENIKDWHVLQIIWE